MESISSFANVERGILPSYARSVGCETPYPLRRSRLTGATMTVPKPHFPMGGHSTA